jgi:hypothetical protein
MRTDNHHVSLTPNVALYATQQLETISVKKINTFEVEHYVMTSFSF